MALVTAVMVAAVGGPSTTTPRTMPSSARLGALPLLMNRAWNGTSNTSAPPATAAGAAGIGGTVACLAGLGLHVNVSYHPNDRYWTFQWIESALYLLLGGLLAAVGRWRIRRHAI